MGDWPKSVLVNTPLGELEVVQHAPTCPVTLALPRDTMYMFPPNAVFVNCTCAPKEARIITTTPGYSTRITGLRHG